MSRKVCVVTGSRGDYGLLRWLIQGINKRPSMVLSVVATGMYLSPEFELTWKEIEEDGLVVDARIVMSVGSEGPSGVANPVDHGAGGFAIPVKLADPDKGIL